jgi:hypothetical protein
MFKKRIAHRKRRASVDQRTDLTEEQVESIGGVLDNEWNLNEKSKTKGEQGRAGVAREKISGRSTAGSQM